jgi:hypothetical protein
MGNSFILFAELIIQKLIFKNVEVILNVHSGIIIYLPCLISLEILMSVWLICSGFDK